MIVFLLPGERGRWRARVATTMTAFSQPTVVSEEFLRANAAISRHRRCLNGVAGRNCSPSMSDAAGCILLGSSSLDRVIREALPVSWSRRRKSSGATMVKRDFLRATGGQDARRERPAT